jgi:hypothetical protein
MDKKNLPQQIAGANFFWFFVVQFTCHKGVSHAKADLGLANYAV